MPYAANVFCSQWPAISALFVQAYDVESANSRLSEGERTLPQVPCRKVAVFTATRAEYGLLRRTLSAIAEDGELSLHVIVGGTHLSTAHGMTVEEILTDGFDVSARVPMNVETNDDANLVRALAECASGIGAALTQLRPDVLVLLGDRYELLPAASAATVLRIPIAHISGGDITEGAIDNQVRHALTKLAHLHLAGTRASADRIVQMGEDPDRVFVTGEPGLDEFVNAEPIAREELARDVGLDANARWILFTYHPETLAEDGVDEDRVRTALDVLRSRPGLQIILTAANADRGGDVLNRILRECAVADPAEFRFVPSLGHKRFVAMMREAHCLVGNSSSGIIEAASVPIPVINIGDRQRGRIRAANVIQIGGDRESLENALDRVRNLSFRENLKAIRNPYGDGRAAPRILKALKDFVLNPRMAKSFHLSQ